MQSGAARVLCCASANETQLPPLRTVAISADYTASLSGKARSRDDRPKKTEESTLAVPAGPDRKPGDKFPIYARFSSPAQDLSQDLPRQPRPSRWRTAAPTASQRKGIKIHVQPKSGFPGPKVLDAFFRTPIQPRDRHPLRFFTQFPARKARSDVGPLAKLARLRNSPARDGFGVRMIVDGHSARSRLSPGAKNKSFPCPVVASPLFSEELFLAIRQHLI